MEPVLLELQPLPQLLTCDYKRFAPEEVHCTRTPSYFVLLFLVKGTLFFVEEGQEVVLHPGQWYLQRKGVFHTGSNPCPGAEYYYFHFDGTEGTSRSEGASLPLFGRYVFAAYRQELQTLLELYATGPWNRLLLQSRFLGLLSRIQRENSALDPRVEEILDYIRANFREPVTSQVLAEVFNFSEKYVERLVQREFGQTPHQYLTQVRLEQAQHLLDQTNLSLKEVGERSGFSDPSVFYRAFRKQHGVSPGQWRKNLLP